MQSHSFLAFLCQAVTGHTINLKVFEWTEIHGDKSKRNSIL